MHDHFYHGERLFFGIKNSVLVNHSADLSKFWQRKRGIAKFSVIATLQ